MKVRNKISRRAQAISAIAVAVIFGGGWLVVWKWPHLQLQYFIARSSPQMRADMEKRTQLLVVPHEPPTDWIPIDLGIVSFSVPPPIEKIEAQGSNGVFVQASGLEVLVGDPFTGRKISKDPRTAILRLYSNGRWRDAGFMEYSHAAELASSTDFRWSSSLEEVLALRNLLVFKALIGQADTRLFSTPYVKGIVNLFRKTPTAHGDADYWPVLAAATDERDYVVIRCLVPLNTGEHKIPSFLASIRFPNKRYGGSAEDLARHIASIVTTQPAATQPAQP